MSCSTRCFGDSGSPALGSPASLARPIGSGAPGEFFRPPGEAAEVATEAGAGGADVARNSSIAERS